MTFELNPDQAKAASTLARDVVVVAGAGSGKTRMLTERFANAVVPGRVEGWDPAAVDEVVAITFTDKAAGEIGERVRLALRDAGLVDDARRVDGAWVSTIHGLCSRLLRRHALEAGIDPRFEVADSVTVGRIREAAFERVATDLVATDLDVGALFDAYDYRRVFSAVVAATRELAVRGLDVGAIDIESAPDAGALLEAAVSLYSDGRNACEGYDGTAAEPAKYADICARQLSRLLELDAAATDEARILAVLASVFGSYKPMRAIKGLEETREDGLARGVMLRNAVGAASVAGLARGFVALLGTFSAEFARSKRHAGVLDFDDLQVEAVRLLTGNDELTARYRDRFRLVMIDEFQDTDALQLRLVESISRNDLCTVGDEKQSIYRFRGADVGVYRGHREQLLARGALEVPLDINYRSHGGILSFVNAVFSSPGYFGDEALLRLRLPDGGRPEQPMDTVLGSGPRVETIFVDCNDVSGADGRRAEARQLAGRVAELCARGADPGDIVMLVRAYTHAHVYAEALSEMGIPALIVGGSRFFGLQEVAIMRALTRAIANPVDDAAVGELIASEFSPISDDGLARLRLVGAPEGRRALWAALGSDVSGLAEPDAASARRLVTAIEAARTDLGTRPLADVLVRAVEDAGYDIRLLSRGNTGRDAFANVLKYVRQASAFEAAGGVGPAGFSAYLEAKQRHGDVEAPASVADDGSSAVRIMSVHASKGLEFPVVIVPDLAYAGGGGAPIVRLSADGGRMRIALAPPTTDDGDRAPASAWVTQMDEIERQQSAEESDRVLYVAFTRARDLLIASGSMNLRPKSGSTAKHHLARLAGLLGVNIPIEGPSDSLVRIQDQGTGEVAQCHVRVVDAQTTLSADVPKSSTRPAERAPIPEPGERLGSDADTVEPPDAVSYSSLHLFEQCPRRFFIEQALRLRTSEVAQPGAEDPARFGSAMHAVLQLVGRDGSLPDPARIAAIGRQFELDAPQLQRLRDGIGRYAESDTASRAVAHERIAREMPFVLPVASGTRLLRGNIDLFARTGDDALIIDYKSGSSGSAEELVARYRLQAECYALAALADGCEAVDIVFVRPEVIEADGGVQEVTYRFARADGDALRKRIDSLCDAIATSPFDPLPKRDERVCGDCPSPEGLCPNARD